MIAAQHQLSLQLSIGSLGFLSKVENSSVSQFILKAWLELRSKAQQWLLCLSLDYQSRVTTKSLILRVSIPREVLQG